MLLRYPAGKPETSFIIPNNVESIGNQAFHDCHFISIEIPESVTSIGDNAFNACHNLVSVEIPSSVTSIGERAFMNCHSLSSINVDSKNNYFTSKVKTNQRYYVILLKNQKNHL